MHNFLRPSFAKARLIFGDSCTRLGGQVVQRKRLLATITDSLSRLSVRELRQRLNELGVSDKGCLEKADLIDRLRQAGQVLDPQGDVQEANTAKTLRGAIEIRKQSALDQFLNGKELRFVAWFAGWCKVCKRIIPEYDRLSLSYPSVHFARVNVDILIAAAEKHKAERYGKLLPTFHAFVAGERVGERKGGDLEALALFVQRKVQTHQAGRK